MGEQGVKGFVNLTIPVKGMGRAWSDECQTGALAHPGPARAPKVGRIEVLLKRILYKLVTMPFGDSHKKDSVFHNQVIRFMIQSDSIF
ncbi:hypothetical protein CH359_01440 [Leptospira meyeri]|nr:hypothetical protein CH359_01440 [Leptospira meyeri]PJZ98115.1 hypothetical protein CH358_03935 [Leptospira meyeri]PKA23342.1 hypothetical protein CH381_26280 [Leptospira sp. mixed culture ATI2-C-A1]